MAELSRGTKETAIRAFRGWGGEIATWAEHWFWRQLDPAEVQTIEADWQEAQELDLTCLPHEGDQVVARFAYALKSWHSTVITVDRKSFWSHRNCLASLGIIIRLPTELWDEIRAAI